MLSTIIPNYFSHQVLSICYGAKPAPPAPLENQNHPPRVDSTVGGKDLTIRQRDLYSRWLEACMPAARRDHNQEKYTHYGIWNDFSEQSYDNKPLDPVPDRVVLSDYPAHKARSSKTPRNSRGVQLPTDFISKARNPSEISA